MTGESPTEKGKRRGGKGKGHHKSETFGRQGQDWTRMGRQLELQAARTEVCQVSQGPRTAGLVAFAHGTGAGEQLESGPTCGVVCGACEVGL